MSLVKTVTTTGWTNNVLVLSFSGAEILNTDTVNTDVINHVKWKDEPISSDHKTPTSYSNGSWEGLLYPYEESKYGTGDAETRLTGTLMGPIDHVTFSSGTGYVSLGSSNAINRVKTECMAKLGEGKIQIGVAVAEALQTANGVADAARDLLLAVVALKKGDVKKLRSIFGKAPIGKTVASRWLQYRLGFVPLMQDLEGAGKLHDEGITDRAANGAKNYIMATRTLSNQRSSVSDSQGLSEIQSNIHCQIVASVSDASAHGLQKLGLQSLGAVAWELVPFSFVVDYAIPVGTLIQAYNAPTGLTFEYGFHSAKNFETRSKEIQLTYSGSKIGDPIEVKSRSESFRRNKLGGFPSVLPYVKNPLSVIHGANVLALIVQARK